MMTMRRKALFVSLLMLVAPLAAAPRKSPAKPATAPTAEAKLIQNCDAHKFETVVDTADENNQPHKSKVRLCGVEGQSDADWIRTLRDAVRKLAADKGMPQAKRDQIVAAIKAEIARLNITEAPFQPRDSRRSSRARSRATIRRSRRCRRHLRRRLRQYLQRQS
jgi:hypothetical protein